jgi:hypothetical protein
MPGEGENSGNRDQLFLHATPGPNRPGVATWLQSVFG